MTTKTRRKTHATRLKRAGIGTHQQCLALLDAMADTGHPDYRWLRLDGDHESDDYVVGLLELFGRTRQAAAAHPQLTVELELLGIGYHSVVVSHADSAVQLTVSPLDGFCGYEWRPDGPYGDWNPAGNFLHQGDQITTDSLQRQPDQSASLQGGIDWIVGQFAAHPGGYVDDGRPAELVGEPIDWNP